MQLLRKIRLKKCYFCILGLLNKDKITPAKSPIVFTEENDDPAGTNAPITQRIAAKYIGYRKFLFANIGACKKKLAPIKT